MFRSICMRLVLCLVLLCEAAVAASAAPVVLVVGDSLSAGFGVATDDGWVALLQDRLAAQGYEHRVVNASASGETTGGGRARLPRALDMHTPEVVIIELGGNDGLRGLPLEQVRSNLAAMVRTSLDHGAEVLLVGMHIPPNYGPAYTTRFHAMYAEVAAEFGIPVVPFFLEGIALDPEMMQDDGIHPNARAQPRMLENLWPALEPLLTAEPVG
jgi:acyl-CoA thioesterase-1